MIRDIDRRIRRALATVRQAVRAVQTALNTGRPIATIQADGLAGEQFQDAELFQHYGYTSAPPDGTEVVIIPIGGKSAHGIIVACENRTFRLKSLAKGEVALYTDEGDVIHFKRGRWIDIVAGEKLSASTKVAEVNASTSATITSPRVTVVATTKVTLDTPQTELTGALTVAGAITGQGGLAISGGSGAQIAGDLQATGDIKSGNISLPGHSHSDPQGGTVGPAQ